MTQKHISQLMLVLLIVSCVATGCSSSDSIINTTIGEMTIKSTEIIDEFSGYKAASGYKFLLIYFTSEDGETKGGFNEAAENVYVSSSTSNIKYEIFFGGIYNSENFLLFSVPESATEMMLYWQGNDPISFTISEP